MKTNTTKCAANERNDFKEINAAVADAPLQRPEWWAAVPAGEKAVIRTLVETIDNFKNSQVPEMSRAAREWELAFKFFVKVRLKERSRKHLSSSSKSQKEGTLN